MKTAELIGLGRIQYKAVVLTRSGNLQFLRISAWSQPPAYVAPAFVKSIYAVSICGRMIPYHMHHIYSTRRGLTTGLELLHLVSYVT